MDIGESLKVMERLEYIDSHYTRQEIGQKVRIVSSDEHFTAYEKTYNEERVERASGFWGSLDDEPEDHHYTQEVTKHYRIPTAWFHLDEAKVEDQIKEMLHHKAVKRKLETRRQELKKLEQEIKSLEQEL